MRRSKHNLWTTLVLTPFFVVAGMTYPLVLSLDVRYALYRALRQPPLDFNEACWVEREPKVAVLGKVLNLCVDHAI